MGPCVTCGPEWVLECWSAFLELKPALTHPTHGPRFVSQAIKTAPHSPPSLYCTCRRLQNAIFLFCGKLQLLWTKNPVLHNDPFKAGDGWHTGACWSGNRHWFTVPGKATVTLVESENEAALLCRLRNLLAFPLVSPDTGAPLSWLGSSIALCSGSRTRHKASKALWLFSIIPKMMHQHVTGETVSSVDCFIFYFFSLHFSFVWRFGLDYRSVRWLFFCGVWVWFWLRW